MKDVVSRCPIEEVMRLLSGRWPTLLLYYLKDGTKRFSDLKRDNPTLSHRMLALELRKLEGAGVIRRTARAGLSAARRVRSHAGGLAAGAADRRPGRLVGGAAAREKRSGLVARLAKVTALLARPPERFNVWYGRRDGPQVWGLLERQKSQ